MHAEMSQFTAHVESQGLIYISIVHVLICILLDVFHGCIGLFVVFACVSQTLCVRVPMLHVSLHTQSCLCACMCSCMSASQCKDINGFCFLYTGFKLVVLPVHCFYCSMMPSGFD